MRKGRPMSRYVVESGSLQAVVRAEGAVAAAAKALSWATAEDQLAPQVTGSVLDEVLALVPEVWLSSPEDRDRYRDYLLARVSGDRAWLPRRALAS